MYNFLWLFIPLLLYFKVNTPNPYNYTWCASVGTREIRCSPCCQSTYDTDVCFNSDVSFITVLESEPKLVCEEDLPYWSDTPAGKAAVSDCPSGYEGEN